MRLVNNVFVNNTWFGPNDDIPIDVAKKITNPKAWVGGVVPSFDEPKPVVKKKPAPQATKRAATKKAD